MPFLRKLYLTLGTSLLLSFLASAQPTVLRPFLPADTPSPGHVNDLLKTSDGFLWFATQDGLFRYDGYQLMVHRPSGNDSTSIPNAFVWTLHEDLQQRVWIGTFGSGLASYDPRSARFSRHRLPTTDNEAQSIRCIQQGRKEELWLGTEKGLWHFASQNGTFRAIQGTTAPDLSIINCLHFIDEDHLLVGAQEGAFIYQPSKNRWLLTPIQDRGVASIDTLNGKIWLGTHQGLFEYDYTPEEDNWLPAREVRIEQSALANAINTTLLDETGMFWIGTLEGLFRFDPAADTAPSPIGPAAGFELPDAHITAILQVEPGLVGVGTRRGLLRFSNTAAVFHHLSQTQLGADFCNNVVLGCTEGPNENWWLGTQGGLVQVMPVYVGDERLPSQFMASCFVPERQDGMPEAYVINTRRSNHEHWATFWRGGLRRIEKGENGSWKFSPVPGLKELTNNAGIHDILTDQQGDTWIATPNRGLIRWNRTNDSLLVFEPSSDSGLLSPYIFHLLEDRQGRLWIGTANGGLCYKEATDTTFTCFVQEERDSSLSNNLVLSVFEDQEGNIWACTAGGLNRWLGDDRFEVFTTANGLPSDIVYGMLQEQETGDYWLSTNAGLVRMSDQNKAWHFQVFQAEDGLQSNEFNQYAFFQTKRGTLCFGGPEGLTYFDPKEVGPFQYTAPVVLTDFQLFSQSQQTGGLLPQTINETKQLELAHNQNYLAFEFAALGYTQAAQHTYAYQLVGIDEDWVDAGKRRYASYPKLPPGDYTFQVKAANHDGVWGQTNKAIDIHICPPWWQRWWAYLIYLMAIGSILILVFQSRLRALRRIDQARLEEREAFRKKTARDFHDEAGNKISKMSLLTEVIKRQAPTEELQPMLQQLEHTIQQLRHGMRDFIWVLDPQYDNLYDTLLRLKVFGQELFEFSGTQFAFPTLPEDWAHLRLSSPVRRHLLLIGKEALHNSLKHAQAKAVEVTFERLGQDFQLRICDDGQGWDSTRPEQHGNGWRNMKARAKKMGAQLQITTAKGQGCCIELRFRITQMED